METCRKKIKEKQDGISSGEYGPYQTFAANKEIEKINEKIQRLQEKYKEAIADYTTSIKLDPNYWYAYNNRAMSYWEMGFIEKAKKDYETVKDLVGH